MMPSVWATDSDEGELVALLSTMPALLIDGSVVAQYGIKWNSNNKSFDKETSMKFCKVFDNAVAVALAKMLGGIPVCTPNGESLLPPKPDCVEVGPVKIIGGIRPQNFDVGYRPDGPRFLFDSKTLNDTGSVGKNWRNMINDIATEATTVHTRFPHAVVAFMVVIPEPCINNVRELLIETLGRLARRTDVTDPFHLAEAIALVTWNPDDGSITPDFPTTDSNISLARFSPNIEALYRNRYNGLCPHDKMR
jgi:hypothetical protein